MHTLNQKNAFLNGLSQPDSKNDHRGERHQVKDLPVGYWAVVLPTHD